MKGKEMMLCEMSRGEDRREKIRGKLRRRKKRR